MEAQAQAQAPAPPQAPQTTDTGRAGAGSYVGAVLLPIVGVILAIIQFARGNSGPGAALLLTSIVAGFIWMMIFVGVAASDYEQCINDAQNLNQQLRC